MARNLATVESWSPAAETFGYLAAFSNAAEWDPETLPVPRDARVRTREIPRQLAAAARFSGPVDTRSI